MADVWQAGHKIIRIYKRTTGNPDYVWQNTYEVHTAADSGTEAWPDVLDEFIAAERTLHLPAVEFIKATVSTWSPDSVPYDPDTFIVHEIAPVAGTRTITGDNLPRHIALHVKRNVPTGRAGKLFYRGVLGEADMVAGASLAPDLTSGSQTGLQTIVSAMYNTMQQSLELYDGSLVLIRQAGPGLVEHRFITSFTVRGLVFNKPDHRYFDRP